MNNDPKKDEDFSVEFELDLTNTEATEEFFKHFIGTKAQTVDSEESIIQKIEALEAYDNKLALIETSDGELYQVSIEKAQLMKVGDKITLQW